MKTRTTLTLAVAAALIPLAASSATRTSADYSLTTETVDSGGRRPTTARYVNDGSVGGIGGISGAVAPLQVAKHSYIGQLYDLASLTVSATPATVNEGATRQLSASADLDDGTTLNLASSSVTWSVIAGPITSIDADGLATAGIVYQDTAALVRGTYQGLTDNLGLLVLDINPDNYGFYAGDGLPDWWQANYFGLDNPAARPDRDPDGDTQSNLHEYVQLTSPTDPASLFRMRIEAVPGFPLRKNVIFSPRYASRTYTVMRRPLVEMALWPPLGVSATSDSGLERTVTDLNAAGSQQFYKVRISVP